MSQPTKPGEEFLLRWGWLLDPLRATEKDPDRLLDSPTTVISEMRTGIKLAFEQRVRDVDDEQVLRDLVGTSVPREVWQEGMQKMEAAIDERRKRIAEDQVGRELLRLADAAHARVKNSPLLVVENPVVRGERCIECIGRLEAARGLRDEPRARAMWRAAADASEPLYRGFAEALWKLADLAEGRFRPPPVNYGVLIENLKGRLSAYPGVLEPDCVRIRNAVDHGHVRYLPDSKTVEMHDVKGWRRMMTLGELEVVTDGMIQAAGVTLTRAIHAFTLAAYLSSGTFGLIGEVCSAIAENDAALLERLRPEAEACQSRMWAEIDQVLAGSAAPSTPEGPAATSST